MRNRGPMVLRIDTLGRKSRRDASTFDPPPQSRCRDEAVPARRKRPLTVAGTQLSRIRARPACATFARCAECALTAKEVQRTR